MSKNPFVEGAPSPEVRVYSKADLLRAEELPAPIATQEAVRAPVEIESLPACEYEKGPKVGALLEDPYWMMIQKGIVTFGPAATEPNDTYSTNPNVTELNQILELKQDFKFQQGLRSGQLKICRSEKPDTQHFGNYRLWVYERNKVTEHYCSALDFKPMTLLREVPLQLTDSEMGILVKVVGRLSEGLFCTSEDIPGQLFLPYTKDDKDIAIVRGMADSIDLLNYFTPKRRHEIAEVLQKFIQAKIEERNRDEKLLSSSEWGVGLAGASVALMALLIVMLKSQGDISKESLAIARQALESSKTAVAQLTNDVDVDRFLIDRTEEARQPGFSNLVGREEEIRNIYQLSQNPQKPHVFVTTDLDRRGGDSAGTGKTETNRRFLAEVAQGKFPNLKDYKIYSLNREAMGRAGAKWSGMSDAVVDALFRRIKGEPCILWIPEAHNLEGMFANAAEANDFVEKILTQLEERNSKNMVLLDTNKPRGLMDHPAFARRVNWYFKRRVDFAEASRILEARLSEFAGDRGLIISPENLRVILHLAPLVESGNKPANALGLLGALVSAAEADDHRGEITQEDIIAYVAERSTQTPEEVAVYLGDAEKKQVEHETGVGTQEKTPSKRPWGGKKGGGGPGNGTTPTVAGGGERISSAGEVSKVGAARVKLGRLAEETGGVALSALPLVAIDLAEGTGLLSHGGRRILDGGWLVAATALDPYAPGSLAVLSIPFAASQYATAAGVDRIAEKYGIDSGQAGHLGNTIAGTVGGVAGTAVIVNVTGGLPLWRQAGVAVQNGLLRAAGGEPDLLTEQWEYLRAVGAVAVVWGKNMGPIVRAAASAGARTIGKRIAEAGVAAVADGPLPIGDGIGAAILVFGILESGEAIAQSLERSSSPPSATVDLVQNPPTHFQKSLF